MKVKKKYIIIICIFLLVVISAFLFKNKNIFISSVNNSKKLAKYEFEKKDEYECDEWIDASTIENSDIIFRDGNYLVINAKNTNLPGDGGTRVGYEGFVFIKNNCAVTSNDFFEKYSNNTNLCSSLKNYISNRDTTNVINWNYWANIYNEYVESGLCTEKIKTKEETHTCSQELDENGWPALRYDGYIGYGFSGASYSTEREWVNFYIDKCGCNENYKYYIKTNDAKSVLKNKCGYSLEETGYHTHNINGQNFCYKDGVWNSKEECSFECTNEYRTKIINDNDISSAQTFNNSCTSLEKIPLSTITIEFNGGWGPETLGSNWGGEDGTYTMTGIDGKTNVVNFNGKELKLYDYPLKGWSKNIKDCTSVVPSNLISTSNITIENGVTYYACYGDDGKQYAQNYFSDSFFEVNGDKLVPKTGTTYTISEINQCLSDEVLNSNLTSVPMKLTNTYIKTSYNTTDTYKAPDVLGEPNIYCSVSCIDTVKVSYPNIFETIPAGQYFELMYEPEINANRDCQTQFRYNSDTINGTTFNGWKNDYEDAIDAEVKALNELSEAEAKLEAAQALSAEVSGECGCCGSEDCDNCGTSYYDEHKASYVNANGTKMTVYQSLSANTCSGKSFGDKKSELVASLEEIKNTKDANYNNAVKHRIALEQMNLQCYTILDSDKNNDVENTYGEVFGNSNTFKYNDNSLVIDDTFKYRTSTALTNLDSNNYGTKNEYVKYTENYAQGLNTDSIKLKSAFDTSSRKSTKNFYYLEPTVSFKYNTGESNTSYNSVKEREETLLIEAHVKLDTGSYTTLGSDIKEKNSAKFTKNFTIEVNKSDSTCDTDDIRCSPSYGSIYTNNFINFDAITTTSTKRSVKYYFTYHEANEYFSKYQSGIIDVNKQNNNKYSSLSYKTKVGTKSILNNVYPVALNAVAGKYDLSFKLTDNANYLNSFVENDLTKFTGNYTCKYEITNDALVSSDKTSKDYKKLKSNTIFRSVITDKIDPNDRASTGKLGENWTNKKGLAVQDSMQKKETNDSSGSKYTYTDDNLEYSFTLTPALIQNIKKYNDTHNYDDFNFSCATEDGRECVSKFLTNLSEGKVDGANPYSNYSSVNSWGFDDLVKTRKKWKYYNGTEIEEKSATVNGEGTITKAAMNLDDYLSSYEKWGVLP